MLIILDITVGVWRCLYTSRHTMGDTQCWIQPNFRYVWIICNDPRSMYSASITQINDN